MMEAATPKPRRWLKPLLFVSLALNLCFIGLIGGTVFRLKEAGGPGGHVAFGSPYVRAMEEADRRAVFEAVRPNSDRRAAHSADRKAQFDEMIALLRAPDFDAQAAKAVLVAQAGHVVQAQSDVQAAWLVRLSEMSEAERDRYADRLQDRLERRARWRDKNKRRHRD